MARRKNDTAKARAAGTVRGRVFAAPVDTRELLPRDLV
jgi:hypothetical protein